MLFQLTGQTIKEIRNRVDLNLVIAPYDDTNAKGCGYNLTATEFVYSVRKKRLLTVHKSNRGQTFVKIPARDTALILSREYVKLSGRLAGAFYSRVHLVSQGFGHISTTLDPGWHGMLLFALNNPSNRKLRLVISESSEGAVKYTEITTMTLSPVQSEGTPNPVLPNLDNPPMRLDVLKGLVHQPRRVFFNSRYQRLRKLILELESFTPAETPRFEKLNNIRLILVEMEKEASSYYAVEELRGWIVELRRANYDDLEGLREKIEALPKPEEGRDKFLNGIHGCILECDYLLTCEKVEQIHAMIQRWVPHAYHPFKQSLYFLAEHWKTWLIYTVMIIGISVIFYNWKTLDASATTLITAVAALLPPFISSLLERSLPSGVNAPARPEKTK